MSLFELAENDFGMDGLGAKLTAAERKAEAEKRRLAAQALAAQRKAAAAAKRQDRAAEAQHRREAQAAKVAAHKVEMQKKKEQAEAVKEAREAAKQGGNLAKMKDKIAKQRMKNEALKKKLNETKARLAAKLAAIKAKPALRGLFDFDGCCPGLIGLAACTEDAQGNLTCTSDDAPGTTTGTSVPVGIQLPPFEPPAPPKGCEGGAKPRRKDCVTYNAVVEAFKQWYEMLKLQLQYEAEIAALNAKIDELSAQLAAGGTACIPGQIDPRTGQLCQTYPPPYPGGGCPAGLSVDPVTGQCTPLIMGPTDAGYPAQYGIPGGGGGQFVPEQTLGPGGDMPGGESGDLPSDFIPFGGGPMGPAQLPYQQPQYAEAFVEQQMPDGQYAPPELAVEIMPEAPVRAQRTAPEDVEQGQEPVVYGGDEEYGAVNDFMEESEGMSGLTSLSHHCHADMTERYFGLAAAPGTAPTDIYGKVVTGIDKAKEIYESLTGKKKPAPAPIVVKEEFPWSTVLIVGGLGLLGYAFYKKAQRRR